MQGMKARYSPSRWNLAMNDKHDSGNENSSNEQSRHDSDEVQANDPASGESGELQGALPPEETKGGQDARDEDSGWRDKGASIGLKRWGPWRRWSWYRSFKRHRSDYSKFRNDRDSIENERGRLPDDEEVQLPAIWTVELYTPSTVNGLLDGIRSLKWEYGNTRDHSLTKWMNSVRQGRLAGWTTLGIVSPTTSAHFLSERTAPLPAGVRVMQPILMSITPSLTAFVSMYMLDDESALSLDTPMRAKFTSTARRDSHTQWWQILRYVLTGKGSRFGYRLFNPDNIRRERIQSCVRDIETRCVDWVRRHVPGVFSSLNSAGMPTAALFITKQVSPMTEESRNIRALSGLAISRNYDAWNSDSWHGAGLVLPRNWDSEGQRLNFACRRRDAFPDNSFYHDPTSNWTISCRADELIRGLLSRWAITCLLDSYHEKLSVLRDYTARNSRYRPVRDLKSLRTLARTMLYDIGVCAQETIEFAESDYRYRYDVLEMKYAREVNGKQPELLPDLQSSQVARANQVRREAELLRATLSISNDLSQTVANIRIQRLVVLLTIISIGIAVWAALMSIRSTP